LGSSYVEPAKTEFRVLFVEPALFYWIIRYSKPDIKHLIYSLIASALVVSIVGIFLFIRGEAVITAEEGARRLASVYGSPNNVAILLSRAIPFALAFAFFPFRKQTPLWMIVLSIFVITLLLTQSAGGLLIGLPTMFAVAAILRWKSKSLIPLAILSLAVIVGFALLSQISPRFERLLDLTSGTVFMRIRVWESSLDILSNHFGTGLGLDQFLYSFRSEYVRPDAIADPDLSHPHNILLDFWIRLGFFGLIWLIVTMWIFFRTAWHALHNLSTISAPVIGTILSMVTLLTYGMIDNSIFLPDMVIIFMFLVWIPHALLEQRQQ
jgi:O-antigen ligase